MNLEINTPQHNIKLSSKFKDRITALLKPVLSQHTSNHQFEMAASGTPNDNCGEESAIYRCKKCGEQCFSWTGVPITDIKLKWYYPTTAESDWPLEGEYLIPIWKFKNSESYAVINAVDGDLRAEWSPKGNPMFTPNDKFYELKDIKTRKWIKDPSSPFTNVERGADIHA